MRGNIVGLLAAALMAVCGVASANIIYNVNLSGGGETVTGTITTDGASGLLTPADFISWSLSASGLLTFSDVGPPPAAMCGFPGCGIEVVGDTMEVIGGVGTFLTLLGTSFVDITFFSNNVLVTQGESVAFIPEAPPFTIGRASVPEPPTAILLGLGLAGLGLARTRARRRPSAAV